MAKDETRRIKPQILAADEESHAALKNITDYAPANAVYTTAALDTAREIMNAAWDRETQAAAAAAAARDDAVAAEWRYHNLTVGMRDQVTAQYGRNSNQAQSVGRKKPSEYKAPKKNNQDD
ncbi:MAG TPA: hypothetical protein VJS44_13115 [Pyrinomonadaceae bacterium]|nr:hypothetical protein [Pyrinomonadaceae bacterium]